MKQENQKVIDSFLDWKNKPLPDVKTKILGKKALVELFYYYVPASKFTDADGRPLAKAESQLYPKAKVLAISDKLSEEYNLDTGDIVNLPDDFVGTTENPEWVKWRHFCQEDPQYAQNYDEPAKFVFNLSKHRDKFYQIDKFAEVKPEEAFRLLLDERYLLTKDED